MNRFPTFLLTALCAAAMALPSPARAELQAGTAIVDITPQEWPLAPRGSFTPHPTDSAHDPLHVRCLVLDDGHTSIALAVVDSCMVHRDVLDPAKRQAAEATGIPAQHMLISASHTHSAPFANAQHGTPQELAYQKRLFAGIVKGIVQAAGNRQPARAGSSAYDLPDGVISTITSCELYTGIAKCASPDKEQAKVDLLLPTVIELPFDQTAAREAGRIRGLLESQGDMIGPYDVLLAAHALAAGLILVTANTDLHRYGFPSHHRTPPIRRETARYRSG